jgi:hypothetical protein
MGQLFALWEVRHTEGAERAQPGLGQASCVENGAPVLFPLSSAK